LEAENAEREREFDDKRESQENQTPLQSNPEAYFEYARLKIRELELIKTIPPALNPFYKAKVNKYFNTFVN
jgi:hypothetical protein